MEVTIVTHCIHRELRELTKKHTNIHTKQTSNTHKTVKQDEKILTRLSCSIIVDASFSVFDQRTENETFTILLHDKVRGGKSSCTYPLRTIKVSQHQPMTCRGAQRLTSGNIVRRLSKGIPITTIINAAAVKEIAK